MMQEEDFLAVYPLVSHTPCQHRNTAQGRLFFKNACFAACVLLFSLLGACATLKPSPPPSPHNSNLNTIVFIVNGILLDFVHKGWGQQLQETLAQQGFIAIRVDNFTEPFGMWFNYGSKKPAQLIVDFLHDIQQLSQQSACPEPVTIHAIGFSHGSKIIVRAANTLQNQHAPINTNQTPIFNNVIFIQPSLYKWSKLPEHLVKVGAIGQIRTYWSPYDVVTLFAPFGAGGLGGFEQQEGVENIKIRRFHLPPNKTIREAIVDDLTHTSPPAPRSTAKRAEKSEHQYVAAQQRVTCATLNQQIQQRVISLGATP